MPSDKERLEEVRRKLIEAEDFIKNSENISEHLSRYVKFLIAKHEILLENVNLENKEVNEIPLIRI